MTRISRLVMKGFKSFANKIEMVFGDHFNCILGPNGSGKSNVLDALCFVLGKSSVREMRAEKAANLIYNGGKRKRPAKEAIVSIYFDNKSKIFGAEFGEEIEISRMVRSNGQSTYRINGKTRTRQQILELLSRARINPDGYNIILQGDIVRFIDMSPLEKRGMIEEVAGISVYEDKKNKAIRELTRVEEKLNEAAIILTERESYLKDLKKERNQAFKFKDLNDKIKQNKATVLNKKIMLRKEKVDELSKRISENQGKVDELRKEVEKLRESISKKKQEIERINKEVEEKAKKELEGQIKGKEKDIALVDKKSEEFRKKNKLEDAQKADERIAEIDKRADAIQEEVHKLREKQQEFLREKDKLELRIQSTEEKIEKVLGLEKENKSAIEKLKSNKETFKKKENELKGALDYDSSLASQLSTARDKLLSRKEEESGLKARSISIQESLGGGIAVKRIMELKGNAKYKGIIGTVSELGQVKEEYALALEVSAGPRLGSVVVETDETAAKCIDYLKDNKLGIATFLPLNKLQHREVNESLRKMDKPGVKGLAIDLITFPEKYRKVFEYVLGSTLVVDNVEVARKLGIGKERMVTLTGDLIETGGGIQGGFRTRRKGLGF